MSNHNQWRITASGVRIEQALEQDLPAVLALFDGAVAWLAEKGLVGQWGSTPFSEQPAAAERFMDWIQQGTLYLARADDQVLGSIVLSESPPAYAEEACAQQPRQALYLEALASDRRCAGQGIGRRLLDWAEEVARQRGVPWLRLDCWAENQALNAYYQQAGFSSCASFSLGSWHGTLFEKPVAR